jgi:hypothetical protein
MKISDMNQQRINNLTGWAIFALSLIVYVLTLEPTLSLWDCGEFLLSAWKLEINHSPGAPLFMLLGHVFSLLSLGNPAKAAFTINLVSAVSSAATILFLYWTIVSPVIVGVFYGFLRAFCLVSFKNQRSGQAIFG